MRPIGFYALPAAVLVWAAPLAAAPAKPAAVPALVAEMETLHAGQAGQSPQAIQESDAKIADLAGRAAKLGWTAVPEIGRRAEDRARPWKVRAYLAGALGLIGDASAFPILKGLLADPDAPGELRAQAAQSLAGLRVSRRAVREALTTALREGDLPPLARSEALSQLSVLGSDDLGTLERIIRSAGRQAREGSLLDARKALRSLSRSTNPGAPRVLVELADYYPRGSELRDAVLDALETHPPEDPAVQERATRALLAALRQERSKSPIRLKAVRLLAAVGGPGSAQALLKILDSPNPELVAEAAEGLARREILQAKAPLAEILRGAHRDPRFSPLPTRPEPQTYVRRIRKALDQVVTAEMDVAEREAF